MLIEFNSIHHDSDMEAKIACMSKQIATCVRFNNPGTSDEIGNIASTKGILTIDTTQFQMSMPI